jgi:hypothetical protein
MEKRIFKSSNDFKDLPKESEALEAVFQNIEKQEVETLLPEKQVVDSASSDPRLQNLEKQVVETSPPEIKSSKKVQFNLDSEDDIDFNNLNNFQNNNSEDQVSDDEELEDKELEDQVLEDQVLEDQELDDPELEDLNSKLSKIYYRFMNKYEHLNNVKNKVLVKEIIKMAIDNLPESDNIDYYLNFIESSIKHFNN